MSCWVALKTLGRLAGAMTAICVDEDVLSLSSRSFANQWCRRWMRNFANVGDVFWCAKVAKVILPEQKKVWTFCLPR
jgi:hypothetical protein